MTAIHAEAAADGYEPFARGRFPVGVRTIEAVDAARTRRFPCEIWYPAAARHAGQDTALEARDLIRIPSCERPRRQLAVRDAEPWAGICPLILFSHGGGAWHRWSASFLCTHLSSHGYVVAALDHSEVVAPQLGPGKDETDAQKAARVEAWIANRVPDIVFLLDHLLDGGGAADLRLDAVRIGIVGHSFGGWTALAAPAEESRIHAVVALAPAGSSEPKPGIIPAPLSGDLEAELAARGIDAIVHRH